MILNLLLIALMVSMTIIAICSVLFVSSRYPCHNCEGAGKDYDGDICAICSGTGKRSC